MIKTDGCGIPGEDDRGGDLPLIRRLPGGLLAISNIALVPRLPQEYTAHCGGTGICYDVQNGTEGWEPIPLPALGPIDEAKPPRALMVDGNSMVDFGVVPHTWVVVNPSTDPTPGSICLVEIGGSPVIKKVYPKPKGILLRASNGEELMADPGDIESGYVVIIGKIVQASISLDHRP